nr:cation:proton antiporter [Saprospiraceae bacterium]
MIGLSIHFNIPLEDPLLVFALVLFIILFSPIVLSRFKIPSIIGLIIAGVVIGPKGLEIIASDEAFKLFGSVGLLYIMFMAGLEIDMNDFQKNKWKSLYFGLNTFILPMVLGSYIGYYIIGLDWLPAILLASMFASHTLIAYPVISKMGLAKLPVVNITVGGTMITDTLALLVLAVVAGMTRGEVGQAFWLTLGISTLLFALLVMVGFPILARWFFRKYEDSVSQYIFILALVYLAALLAEMAGLETIIGAFFAGLALNRLVPHTSPMMNRIEFIGNALFIPFFLISVGMLVDVRVLFQGFEAIFVAVVMTIVALGAKWLAAWVTQKSFRWSVHDRNLMFGLSSTQAAATLAVVFVGLNLGLFNEAILNGTVLMILVTCLAGSYYAEKAGVEIEREEAGKLPEVEDVDQRILISLHREERIKSLFDLSAMVRNPKSKEPFFSIFVAEEGDQSREILAAGEKVLKKAEKYSGDYEQPIQLETRVDKYIASGISRASKDIHATEVVMGWSGNKDSEDVQFSSMLDKLIDINPYTLLIYRTIHPINTLHRIVVAMPGNAEQDKGFEQWVSRMANFARNTGNNLHFFCTENTEAALEKLLEKKVRKKNREFHRWTGFEDLLMLSKKIQENDLLVVISARSSSPAYSTSLVSMPAVLCRNFPDIDIVFIIPETHKTEESESPTDDPFQTNPNWTLGYNLFNKM